MALGKGMSLPSVWFCTRQRGFFFFFKNVDIVWTKNLCRVPQFGTQQRANFFLKMQTVDCKTKKIFAECRQGANFFLKTQL
jgi:hypothetical protein